MLSPRLATIGGVVVSLMLASSVRAEAFLAEPEGTSGAAQPVPRVTAPVITTEQLAYFAELVGEPRPVVWQRLQADPALVPFAAAAGDARRDRKSSGKVRTAVGFSIFGVGGITGYIVMLSALTVDCGYGYGYTSNSCDDRMGNRFLLGALIMAASAGLGLGIGIPGIISMARQSETETAAVDRYQYPQMPIPAPYLRGDPAMSGGYGLKLPLLSLLF
jgi:hypothetical protein